MPDWIGPLGDQIGITSALIIAALLFALRVERTDRKEAEEREREATKSYIASINSLSDAMRYQGGRNG